MSTSEMFHPLAGGALIGLAGVLLLFSSGKVAGISGMLGGILRGGARSNGWRVAFLLGLITAGFLFRAADWTVFAPLSGRSAAALMLAGLLVGLGTQLGSGCTSGHGVCGIGRGSKRSIVATITFMLTGIATVALVRFLAGGVL